MANHASLWGDNSLTGVSGSPGKINPSTTEDFLRDKMKISFHLSVVVERFLD